MKFVALNHGDLVVVRDEDLSAPMVVELIERERAVGLKVRAPIGPVDQGDDPLDLCDLATKREDNTLGVVRRTILLPDTGV
ncbi:MAG: hypothetical protein CMH39_00365 [Micrococcales bacterium]|nr:hypothetical protein [Micrococcales bacterium]